MKKLLGQLPAESPVKPQRPELTQNPRPRTGALLKRPPLLVAPFDARQASLAQQEWAKYLGIDVEVTNQIGMKFRIIPPERSKWVHRLAKLVEIKLSAKGQ